MAKKSPQDIAVEIERLFGPAPILSTECAAYYREIQQQFIECILPGDILLYSLVREVTNSTWEMKRYTRYKTVAIESKFRERCEQQAELKRRTLERNQELP